MGLWDWDLTTDNVFVDRTYFGFLGVDQEDQIIPINDLVSLVHPEDLADFSAATREALRGKAPLFQAQHRMRHADGRWVWLETCGNVTQRDADGRATRMTGTHTNITERKQLARALSNTLRVMHDLLETLPLPVILRDTDQRVTLVNAAWEKMLGIARQDIIGMRIESYPNWVISDNQQESDLEVLSTKRAVRYETIVHGMDGTNYDVIVAKTALVAEDGTVTGLASVVTDISEQKRTAEVLEKARVSAEAAVQAKSRFLANMSHELRTPLNGVVGMASLLENTALDAKQRRFVRTLKTSAEALITLINDVLDLSKAEAGKLELARGPFELRRELEQVIGLFGARAYDKGIELAAHIARGVPATIHGDPIRLRQVLGNLVNNAVKFTESGAVLLAVAVVPGDAPEAILEFSVTDTGVGVAPEEQKRIFEAFEQADGSVTRKFGGTGLGLAISRQFVELMHGTMGAHQRTRARQPLLLPHSRGRAASRPAGRDACARSRRDRDRPASNHSQPGVRHHLHRKLARHQRGFLDRRHRGAAGFWSAHRAHPHRHRLECCREDGTRRQRLARRRRPTPGGGHCAHASRCGRHSAGRRESQSGETSVHLRSHRDVDPRRYGAEHARPRVAANRLAWSRARGGRQRGEPGNGARDARHAGLPRHHGIERTWKACWQPPPIPTST